jgi:predicted flap endonuclease-1-like 5' DNA nuclease
MGYTDGLLAGLIIGFLLEWVMDWFFWRRLGRRGGKQSTPTQGEGTPPPPAELEHELAAYKARLADAEKTIDSLRTDLNRAVRKIPPSGDRFERINGISSAYAGRLREAGINSYDQLSALTPARIKRIVKPGAGQKIEPEKWINEARKLAKETARLPQGADQ